MRFSIPIVFCFFAIGILLFETIESGPSTDLSDISAVEVIISSLMIRGPLSVSKIQRNSFVLFDIFTYNRVLF